MAFLIDSLKEKFGDKEKGKGFDDLNYVVGNTSGMDIGNVPSPLDQRIGRMSQIGGSVMEVQITNPATFHIDRPELMNVINQIGFPVVTLHGDPNIGFTGGYATRGQGVTGYNIVHRYFKRYLEQMASFKWETEQNPNLDYDVGYVNMHASNEQIPPREERLANGVSVDPFGQSITNINGDKKPNIYRNEEFLEKLFHYFFCEMVEQPWRQYEEIFSDEDEDFREEWNEAKAKEADKYFYGEAGYNIDFKDQVALFQTAAGIDAGAEEAFLNELENHNFDEGIKVRGIEPAEDEDEEPRTEVKTFTNLAEISQYFNPGSPRQVFDNPSRLSRDIYELRNGNLEPGRSLTSEFEIDVPSTQFMEVVEHPSSEDIKNTVFGLIKKIWGRGAGNDDKGDLSAEGKLRSLSRNLDIQNTKIYESAQDKEAVRKAAKEAFSDWDNKRILKNLTEGRVRADFNKESSLFFHILPAWMQTADVTAENHDGWSVPKFIWESIVGENEDDPYWDTWDEFEDFLDRSRENQLNVIAAVAACYLWGHFTQKEDNFDLSAFEPNVTDFEGFEKPDLEGGEEDMKWIEWMNKFGLKVNMEAMFGSPGELRRLWRPKDIAVACHAINKEAKKILGDDYEENLVKFTIDMEHTASYGVDPWTEMQTLVEQEKSMARNGKTDADPSKPLAEIVKTYHLTKPGWEQQSGHRHGPFARGDETLYFWLYNLVENGFARNPDDEARIIFEVGGEYHEEMYVIRVAMDMVEMGIEPGDLDPNRVDPNGDYDSKEDALIARFFGMDKPNVSREWAKIEEHAFDPLKGLLEAQEFDYTWSSNAAVEQGGKRPTEWKQEEYT